MTDSPVLFYPIRRIAVPLRSTQERGGVRRGPAEDAPEGWLRDGLPAARVHELFAAEAGDAAAAAGFGVAMALTAAATPVLWLRTQAAERDGGRLHATGFHALGLDPAALVMAVVADEAALLRAASDAARCPGVRTLVVELWGQTAGQAGGRTGGLDLTATRRLQLAAEASGATVLLLRVAAPPSPSAALTRWGVAACPSTALAAGAPGAPAFLIELLRRRGGPAGQRWRVEWDRDTTSFHTAPLSGAGLPLAADRAIARDPPAPVRRTG